MSKKLPDDAKRTSRHEEQTPEKSTPEQHMIDISSKMTNLRIQECHLFPPRPLFNRKGSLKKELPSPTTLLLDAIWELVFSFLEPRELLRKPTTEVCVLWRNIARSKNMWESLRRHGILFSQRLILAEKLCERRSRGFLWRCTRLYFDYALPIDVYPLAQDDVALRQVSLETVNAGVDDGVPASILRLRASMDALLPHENILEFVGIELHNEIVEIATKWAPKTLRDAIEHYAAKKPDDSYPNKRNSTMEEKREAIQWLFYQLFSALVHMRNNQIIHRNLKPENIFLDVPSVEIDKSVVCLKRHRCRQLMPAIREFPFKTAIIKIGDFSFSRSLNLSLNRITPEDPKERERSGREARRTWYRAPELFFRPDTYGYEIDVWSLGCVLAEAAAGEALFQSECEMDHLFKVFRLCGSPNPAEWPELLTYSNFSANLPCYTRMDFQNDGKPGYNMKNHRQRKDEVTKLAKIREVLGVLGMDLLDKILTLQPSRRITAREALKHPFFARQDQSAPYAEDRDEMYMMVRRSKEISRPVVPHPNLLMRRSVLEWIIESGESLLLSRETTHLAVCAYDRVHDVPDSDDTVEDSICVAAVCLKMAEAFHEPSKEYYKQTNFLDYRERFVLARTTTDLVKWEKLCWRRLNLHMRISTPWWFYQSLSHMTDIKSKPGEALVELMLFDTDIVSANIAPHLLGLTCFACGIVLTHQVEALEAHPAWHTLRTKYPDFFWPAHKQCAHEMFLQQLTKSASPNVVRDLKRPSLLNWRSPHRRKSIDGNFPPLPWQLDVMQRLSAQPLS